ncbi:hypothetical protein TNCV_2198011 [Trichonephila clavipes]|nr:hypothetical protein TNCV_2198011 [Trichonephila clavipes]
MWVRRGSTNLMAGKVVFLRGPLNPIRVVDLMSATETCEMLKHMYHNDTLQKTKDFKCNRRFREARESIEDAHRCGRPQTSHSSENIKKVSANNLVALHFKYDQARRRFVEWAQNEIAVAPDFHKRILFSDEAHFWLNGYVNTQNCRIWSEANPQVYVKTPLHPEKLTVWCALWAGGIIGPYFFKNDEGHNVTPLVYADKPQTLDHLEDNIRRVIADIRPQMLEKVIENWTSRLDYIRASHGSPMPEIIFKV